MLNPLGLPNKQGTAHHPLAAVHVGRGVDLCQQGWTGSLANLYSNTGLLPAWPKRTGRAFRLLFLSLQGCPWEMGAGTGWLAPGEQSRRGCRAFLQPTRCSCVRG